MRKDLKKNKKGFTLVEIIVVLLIIGILLAITIPSIMGYVNQANDAALEAKARSGYVAAQSLVARDVANGTAPSVTTDKETVTGDSVTKELGEKKADGSLFNAAEGRTIQKAGCVYNGNNIKACAFVTEDNTSKIIVFDTTDKEEPTKVLSSEEVAANDLYKTISLK